MVDFGATALMGLRRAGFEPNQLAGIAFTHLHGDHIGGFPFLVIDALFNSSRSERLSVLGPPLTRSCLEAPLTATYGNMTAQLPLQIDEFAPGEQREFLGYRVAAFAADHMLPPHRPLCLRITDPAGKSVAFSGDTRPCPGLFAASDSADLLVAECTRLSPPAGQHCTWDDWQRMLPGLRAKSLLLSHLGSDVREQLPGLRSQIESAIPIQFADDGMILEC